MTDKKEDGWFGLKEKLFDFMLSLIPQHYYKIFFLST